MLTDAKLRNAKPREKAYKLFDGGGLYLLVKPNGSRLWLLKYRLAAKERTLSIGRYPEVPLVEARDQRDKARRLLREGRDPSTEKQAARAKAHAAAATTFEGVAREWIETNAEKWSASYRANILGLLRVNVFPRLGATPISDIDAPLLMVALKHMETRGALETLSKVREYCSRVFRYAIATGRAQFDPAAALRGAFKTRQAVNHPHLPRAEIGPFLRALEDYPGKLETKLAVKLLLLTFVRTGELRAAQWSEFDFDKKEWHIPAERMKMRTPHVVPLSTQAIAALEQLRMLTGYSSYLFPNHGKHPYMSENTVNGAIRRLGYKGKLVVELPRFRGRFWTWELSGSG
ncbi:MAG: integrase arm-type DNA-binding domain-containing protein [Gammaproteobacteria bacterium]